MVSDFLQIVLYISFFLTLFLQSLIKLLLTLYCHLGTVIEEWFVSSLSDPSQNFELTHKFSCKECQDGCETCVDDSPCFVTYNHLLRSIILGLQSFCATLTLILTIVIFKYRRYKVCTLVYFYQHVLINKL